MSKRKLEDDANRSKSPAKKSKSDTEATNGNSEAELKRLRKEEKRKRKAAKADASHVVSQLSISPGHEQPDDEDDKIARRKAKEEKRATKEAKRAAKHEKNKDISVQTIDPSTSKSVSDAPLKNGNSSATTSFQAIPQSETDEYLKTHDIKYVDATSPKANLQPITKFEHLPSDFARADVFKNFSAPTPVQASTWPYMLNGRDVIGVAETGSGKTLAFGLPCIQRIAAKSKQGQRGTQAVIVSPTRELASQIYDQLKVVATPLKIQVCCVYGGVPKDYQREELRTAQIVVATPGRLNDFLQEGAADLSNAEFACLDEADRMLDKGFEEDIRKILGATAPSARRQTVMFTATWPQSVRDLANTFMKTPVQVYIGSNVGGELQANLRIEQKVEVMDPKAKDQRLYQILREYQTKNKKDRILIFCLYKKEATRVEGNIRYKGFNVAGIHGDMTQQKRMESLEAFKNGTVPYLVATDVAARGLDIPAVKLVLNMTFPLTAEDYVHRIGRTGRAGQQGKAITFFTEHEKHLSGALINVLKSANQPVPEELLKFGTTVKKKEHAAYGAFFKDVDTTKKATKITFD